MFLSKDSSVPRGTIWLALRGFLFSPSSTWVKEPKATEFNKVSCEEAEREGLGNPSTSLFQKVGREAFDAVVMVFCGTGA